MLIYTPLQIIIHLQKYTTMSQGKTKFMDFFEIFMVLFKIFIFHVDIIKKSHGCNKKGPTKLVSTQLVHAMCCPPTTPHHLSTSAKHRSSLRLMQLICVLHHTSIHSLCQACVAHSLCSRMDLFFKQDLMQSDAFLYLFDHLTH